jgi:hypothetical protein
MNSTQQQRRKSQYLSTKQQEQVSNQQQISQQQPTTQRPSDQGQSRPYRQRDGWIPFNGHIVKVYDVSTIVQANDRTKSIVRFGATDVRLTGGAVAIRVGAKAEFLRLPKAAPRNAKDPGKCRGAGSMCTGNAEFCCDDGEAIGSCHGEWACPV